ncbi:uncharacterized protein PgNI_07995 [Pyricularia grisea]|uniref:Uncharacterized protein n=1 Tax=Pyricularia grisea TaxID=148305 RepID=A0A6P8AX03_PYRGI|nr:uncharacterized protein PgNI_07995 [Pyricularia grisea]TLD06694.1 hypothetical protein PgNI_07995 [Pyricularia grisea]
MNPVEDHTFRGAFWYKEYTELPFGRQRLRGFVRVAVRRIKNEEGDFCQIVTRELIKYVRVPLSNVDLKLARLGKMSSSRLGNHSDGKISSALGSSCKLRCGALSLLFLESFFAQTGQRISGFVMVMCLRARSVDRGTGAWSVEQELGAGAGSRSWELGAGAGSWELGAGAGSRSWELGAGAGSWEQELGAGS